MARAIEEYRGWQLVETRPGVFGAWSPDLPHNSDGMPHVRGLTSVEAVRTKIDSYHARPSRGTGVKPPQLGRGA